MPTYQDVRDEIKRLYGPGVADKYQREIEREGFTIYDKIRSKRAAIERYRKSWEAISGIDPAEILPEPKEKIMTAVIPWDLLTENSHETPTERSPCVENLPDDLYSLYHREFVSPAEILAEPQDHMALARMLGTMKDLPEDLEEGPEAMPDSLNGDHGDTGP